MNLHLNTGAICILALKFMKYFNFPSLIKPLFSNTFNYPIIKSSSSLALTVLNHFNLQSMARTGNAESKSVNANRSRKRVEAETSSVTLKRAKNGSAFTQCEGCNKSVAVALISMHDCGLDAKIKMNLETMCVETASESVAKKPAERKKSAKEPSVKKSKKERDPSKPKKPPTAFFIFMEDFRKSFKEANPDNKKVAVVAKEGGEKWKSMSEEEKKVYTEKAAKLKEEYQKALENPNENDKAVVVDLQEKESIDVEEDVEAEGSAEKEVEVVADDE